MIDIRCGISRRALPHAVGCETGSSSGAKSREDMHEGREGGTKKKKSQRSRRNHRGAGVTEMLSVEEDEVL